MKNQVTAFLLVVSVGALSAACSSESSPASSSGGSTSTSSGGSTSTGNGVVLLADATGYVQNDTIGLKGAWYAYADSISPQGEVGKGSCQTVGMHPSTECSVVKTPAAGTGFPNTDSKLCTSGSVEAQGTLGGSPDYSNQWGAGIGLDFNNAGMGAMKMPFDASSYKGVSFEIDNAPLTGLRVEFPDQATDGKSAAYWALEAGWKPSPVVKGVNTILWAAVIPPDTTVPALTTSKLMGIQFHVPVSASAGEYNFCISKLTLLK
ncbi:MAG: hypothetical protein QM756_10720 [Polyangiaceae bacterium]